MEIKRLQSTQRLHNKNYKKSSQAFFSKMKLKKENNPMKKIYKLKRDLMMKNQNKERHQINKS